MYRSQTGDRGVATGEPTVGRLERIALVGAHRPTRSHVAAYTTDLADALAEERPDVECLVAAVSEDVRHATYPPRVAYPFSQDQPSTYHDAADFLNLSGVQVTCVQYGRGVYGGAAGRSVLDLVGDLQMPVVTTMHEVPRSPTPAERRVILRLGALSSVVVATSAAARDALTGVYGLAPQRVTVIPYGAPDVPASDPDEHKAQMGLEGRKVLLSFGLLTRAKGVEAAIRALPAVLQRHPETVYIVLGATDPAALRVEGETYRLWLQRLADEVGVADSVIMHGRYVGSAELLEFIRLADVVLAPYVVQAGDASPGTIAYALGVGRPVIATRTDDALEHLGDGRGVLVDEGDVQALGEAACALLDDARLRREMGLRAHAYTRQMVWPEVARRYLALLTEVRQAPAPAERPRPRLRTLASGARALPPVNAQHLVAMTDDTAMLQHSIYTVPRLHEGYCTDDNARALRVAALLEATGVETPVSPRALATRYLSFLWHAFRPDTGRFRNFMLYERRWREEVGSEDSHGRALWALGALLGRPQLEVLHGVARQLFCPALPVALTLRSPRAWAFTLIGIHEYLRRNSGDCLALDVRRELSERLLRLYHENASDDWPWFEDRLTYCNAILPHAMLLSGQWLPSSEMTEVGLRSLEWLVRLQTTSDGVFAPIGTNGFYRRGGERAWFDQQPVEAQNHASACLEAHRMTRDPIWLEHARRAFEWFLGRNMLGLALYDPVSGGCRDGLHPDRANENQGAESTLAFLQILLEMHLEPSLVADLELEAREGGA